MKTNPFKVGDRVNAYANWSYSGFLPRAGTVTRVEANEDWVEVTMDDNGAHNLLHWKQCRRLLTKKKFLDKSSSERIKRIAGWALTCITNVHPNLYYKSQAESYLKELKELK